MNKHLFKTNIKVFLCNSVGCLEKNQELQLPLYFVNMLKCLCLNFLFHKYSKASLNSFLFKKKTISFIEAGSYSTNKISSIKVKQLEKKNASKQKQNQKEQESILILGYITIHLY